MIIPLQLPPGIERNGTAYETPNRWYDMSLMRWVSGALQPVGGWERITDVPLDSTVRRFFTWRDNINTPGILVGTDRKLFLDWGGVYIDITPAGFVPPIVTTAGGYGMGPYGAGAYGTPRPPPSAAFVDPARTLWSFDNWGEDVFFVASSDGRLFHYVRATGDVLPTEQTGAPTGNVGVLTTEERYVMLIGTTMNAGPDIGTFYPRRIAWCSQENPSDWNFSSLTNTAGFLDLDARSPLLRGVRVTGGYLIFSSTEVFFVRYQGLPYIYGAERIGTFERLNVNTIATWNGQAMWWTNKGFQAFSGGVVQSVPCPIFSDVMRTFDPTWGPVRAFGSHNGNFPELWFFYPSSDAEPGHSNIECNRYLAYNYLEPHWTWGALQRTAMIGSGATRLPMMGGVTPRHLYEHEVGWTSAGEPLLGRRFIESGALGVGGGQNLAEVRQLMLATDTPAGTASPVDIRFFGRYTPDGAERTFGPYVPRSDGYTDTRVNAREARIRITSTRDAAFSIGTMRLDVAQGGTR